MKTFNKYIGIIAAGAAIMAAPSCSDTWDEHYNNAGVEGETATETLWEQICSNPKLSKYKAIAEKVHYFKDEAHPQANYTFKDMLSGTQLLTVWAPEDDAISDADYQNWLQLAETTKGQYTLQQQVLGNSIALFRNNVSAGIDTTLTMINGKKYEFDQRVPSMAGVNMKEINVAAINGVLHTVGDKLPFHYNHYEFLKDAANTEVSHFHDVIINSDTTYFVKDMSIEGNPDIDGNPTYVDSVYLTSNTMFMGTHRFPTNLNTDQYLTHDESFGANIESEDSAYIMIMPSDKAWEAAYEKLKSYYNYAPIYVDKEKGNQGTTNVFRKVENTDSLMDKNILMDIVSPLCFNLNMQPNAAGRLRQLKMDDFIAEKGASSKYLLNTFGDTLRTDENWDKASIFNGKKVDMSNGVAFIADEWAFPEKLYKPNLTIEIGWQSLYNSANATGTAASYSFSNTAAEAWVDSVGRVSEDNFYYIYPASDTGNPKFEFKLQGTHGENHESDVMSGKYDVYAIMVPNYYMVSSDSIVLNEGVAKTVNGELVPLKHKLVAELSYCNGDAKGKETTKKSDVIDYQGEKVDTLLLFKDFEFPYSYKNLRQSYPTLSLTTKTTSTERKNGYSNDFCIDRILLISKEDNVATKNEE